MSTEPAAAGFRCGYIAIVGRPNVGKSTLMNKLVGAKVSITSRKAQTTRHRITGIQTHDDAQYVYIDTPGFQTRHSNALNKTLNRTVTTTLTAADVVLFVVEAGHFGDADAKVLSLVPSTVPAILVINKADHVKDKAILMKFAQEVAQKFDFAAIVPVSAKQARFASIYRKASGFLMTTILPIAAKNSSLLKSFAKKSSALWVMSCRIPAP